jgi:hypothetical protein
VQWVAIMFVAFLVIGLRVSRTRFDASVLVVVVVAATLAVWYSQLSFR